MNAPNPYASPQGELVNENSCDYGAVRFFSPRCRIGRIRYLAHLLLVGFLFSFIIGIVTAIGVANTGEGSVMNGLLMGAVALVYIAYIACFWIIIIQRCHDLNKSGYISLLMLVPVVNIFIGFYLLFAPGTRGENRFGKRPPPNSGLVVALVLVLPVVAIIGILAAVAIPAYQDYVERANQAIIQQK